MEKEDNFESSRLQTPYHIYADQDDYINERIHITKENAGMHTTLCNKSLDLENYARKHHYPHVTCKMCIKEYDEKVNKRMNYSLDILYTVKASLEEDYKRIISRVRDRRYTKEEETTLFLLSKRMYSLEESIKVLEEFNI